MQRERFTLNTPNGALEGVFLDAGNQTPLVIIANGQNGFFNYGMFPHVQQSLAVAGISVVGFNYSHAGLKPDEDVFTDLERYRKNSRELEKEDLLQVLQAVDQGFFGNHATRFILAHSMGGIGTVRAAAEAQQKGYAPDGVILLCCLSTLNCRTPEIMEAWIKNKVWMLRNNRTQQDLPLGKAYLQETLDSVPGGKLDPEPLARSLRMPVYIVHGEADESVPLYHSESLFNWCGSNHPANAFVLIPEASHTLNTRHPFEGSNPQLEQFIEGTITWIQDVTAGNK